MRIPSAVVVGKIRAVMKGKRMNGHEGTHDRGDETVVAGADDEDVDVLGVGTGGHVLALSGGHGGQRRASNW